MGSRWTPFEQPLTQKARKEKYNVIRSMYFQGCVGALLVYDVTRRATFDTVNTKWLSDFNKYVKKEGTYILIGNKIDLAEQRAVNTDEGKSFAESIDASDFIETSAKKGENVERAFEHLVLQILRKLGEIE